MSSLEFSKLASNPVDLIPSQKTKIFVSTAYNRILGESPVKVTVSAGGTPALADGVLTIDLTADEAVTLYEGTRFIFAADEASVASSTKIFYLSQQVVFDGTTAEVGVKLEGKTGATIPLATDEAYLVSYIPFFSANSINVSDNGEQIEDNVFSGGFNMEKALIGLNQSAELSGPRVIGDPGYAELSECRNTGKVVDVMVVYPFRTGGEMFTAIVSELSRNSERGAFQQCSATLGITGTITEFN
jgi:hypothetical protein